MVALRANSRVWGKKTIETDLFDGDNIPPMNCPLTIALCSCPQDHAETLATGMVDQRLAACVKVVGPGLSVYRWNDKVERSMECILIIKTVPEHWNALQQWVSDHHPYDVPELIALPVEATTDGYLKWIIQSTTQSASH